MYTTQAKVEDFLQRDLTEQEAEQIDDVISYVSDLINAYTNRSWNALVEGDEEIEDIEPSERLFDGNGQKQLTVGDFTTLSQVRILDSQGEEQLKLTLATDWILSPPNATIKQKIYLRSYHFPVGNSNVEITAIWGSGAVPSGVVVVATALAGNFLTNTAVQGKEFKSESIEGYSYTRADANTSQETTALLSQLDIYKKLSL